MILGFNLRFREPILAENKIHTIREDRFDRWKTNQIIHFATGVRTKNYDNFQMGICTGIDTISIRIKEPHTIDLRNYRIRVNGNLLSPLTIERLALNDGFRSAAGFMRWFRKDFTGKIIYWTRNANIY